MKFPSTRLNRDESIASKPMPQPPSMMLFSHRLLLQPRMHKLPSWPPRDRWLLQITLFVAAVPSTVSKYPSLPLPFWVASGLNASCRMDPYSRL